MRWLTFLLTSGFGPLCVSLSFSLSLTEPSMTRGNMNGRFENPNAVTSSHAAQLGNLASRGTATYIPPHA